ncbi:MAG: tetratricopeptide repeat protein [Acidobacteria bacterium]|nr:tetratricopeptide repeat protein [Acidobacteriota bacterium]
MHCEIDEILEVLEGRGESSVEHIESCASCSSTLRDLRWLTRALSDRLSWNRGRTTEERVEALTRLAAEIDDADTPLGKVHADCRRSRAVMSDDPTLALELATRARNDVLALCGRYEEEAVRAALGMAQKERANALRVLGRYDEALAATRGARTVARESAAADFDLAILDYIDATIYREIGELDEALEMIDRCSPIFEEFGESVRVIHTDVLRGAVLFSAGRNAEACMIFRRLLPIVQDLEDAELEARVWMNLAGASSGLGEYDEASIALVHAREGWKRLGARAESIRAEWSLANLTARRGDFESSEKRLRLVVDELSSLSMVQDFTLAALDLVEILLVQNKIDEARRLLERAISEMSLRPVPTRKKLLAAMRELARVQPLEASGLQSLRAEVALVIPAAGPAISFQAPTIN